MGLFDMLGEDFNPETSLKKFIKASRDVGESELEIEVGEFPDYEISIYAGDLAYPGELPVSDRVVMDSEENYPSVVEDNLTNNHKNLLALEEAIAIADFTRKYSGDMDIYLEGQSLEDIRKYTQALRQSFRGLKKIRDGFDSGDDS